MILSIITINLNNKPGLEKTISSVINQTFDDFEYIIIDGGSSDGSLEIIKKYTDKYSYWASERDKGIYNAMNKGILKATGKYCLFLNSGDYLVNDNVISSVFSTEQNTDIIYGSILNDYSTYKREVQYPHEKYITFRHFLKSTLPHPSTFIKRSLFDKVGLFNEDLIITSDWEFFLKAIFKYNASIKKLEQPIAVYEINGLSSDIRNKETIESERKKVLETHFYRFIDDYNSIESMEKSIPFLAYKMLRNIKNILWKKIN